MSNATRGGGRLITNKRCFYGAYARARVCVLHFGVARRDRQLAAVRVGSGGGSSRGGGGGGSAGDEGALTRAPPSGFSRSSRARARARARHHQPSRPPRSRASSAREATSEREQIFMSKNYQKDVHLRFFGCFARLLASRVARRRQFVDVVRLDARDRAVGLSRNLEARIATAKCCFVLAPSSVAPYDRRHFAGRVVLYERDILDGDWNWRRRRRLGKLFGGACIAGVGMLAGWQVMRKGSVESDERAAAVAACEISNARISCIKAIAVKPYGLGFAFFFVCFLLFSFEFRIWRQDAAVFYDILVREIAAFRRRTRS